MALLTTSRYASEETRKAARSLAASSGARFVARGKKTIAALAEFARRAGDASVGIVEERGGKPAFISSVEVLERGGWRWAPGFATCAKEPVAQAASKKGRRRGSGDETRWSGRKEVVDHEGKGKD